MPDSKIKFGAAHGEDPVAFAKKLEDMGFDSAWASDHVWTPQGGQEGYTYLAAMAAATNRITIGSRVIVLPLRHPLMNAKMATQVDIISGGRFIFGVGVGGDYPPEFANLNVPRSERGRRANENLEIMTRLFKEESVTYKGKYYQVENLSLNPKPIQKPHPPIWMGGRFDAAVIRAAKYADGWLPNLNTLEHLKANVAQIKKLANEYKRDISHFQVGVVTRLTIAETHDIAHAERVALTIPSRLAQGARESTNWDQVVDRFDAHGTAKDIIEFCERRIEAGASHFVFNMSSNGQRLDHDLKVLKDEVIPYFRGK